MGTSVVSGTARLLVCRTGSATAIGEIAHTLNLDPPPTAFELGTRRFGMLIMRLTVLMVLFVLMVNTLDAQAAARIVPVRHCAWRWALRRNCCPWSSR